MNIEIDIDGLQEKIEKLKERLKNAKTGQN